MGAKPKPKGDAGERELAGLLTERLGSMVKRRLGQARDGGHDLLLDGWALESKRAAKLDIKKWWLQTLDSAEKARLKPVLAYRLDRHQWRFVVRLSDVLGAALVNQDFVTAELCIDGFCTIARESIESA